VDLETDDVEAEVRRLEALGATRNDHQQERGFDFCVTRDPLGQRVLRPSTERPGTALPAPAMDYLTYAGRY
jgi:Glyoxalase-like domain